MTNPTTQMSDADREALGKFLDAACYQDEGSYERFIMAEAFQGGLAHAKQWRPIAEAPKDGTHILVINATSPYPPTTVHWFHEGFHLSINRNGEHSEYWGATHWMPLPTPPQAQEGGE